MEYHVMSFCSPRGFAQVAGHSVYRVCISFGFRRLWCDGTGNLGMGHRGRERGGKKRREEEKKRRREKKNKVRMFLSVLIELLLYRTRLYPSSS